MPARTLALAFDVYGTLADPAGMAGALSEYTDDAEGLARNWRTHQLEISWLVTLMERYESFQQVTAHALEVTLQQARLELSESERRGILERIELKMFDDVPDALERLQSAGLELAVFSNGTQEMLESFLARAGIRQRFGEVISVEPVRRFKPAPAVYRYAAERLGRKVGEIGLVSGNPFDAAGGKAAGMRVAKVERQYTYAYPFVPPPDLVVHNLGELAEALG